MENLVETACLNDSAEYLKWASSIAKESAEQPKRKFLVFAGKFPEGTKISIEDIDKHFPDELSKIITTIHQLINDAQTPDSEFQIHTHPEEKSVSIKRRSVKDEKLSPALSQEADAEEFREEQEGGLEKPATAKSEAALNWVEKTFKNKGDSYPPDFDSENDDKETALISEEDKKKAVEFIENICKHKTTPKYFILLYFTERLGEKIPRSELIKYLSQKLPGKKWLEQIITNDVKVFNAKQYRYKITADHSRKGRIWSVVYSMISEKTKTAAYQPGDEIPLNITNEFDELIKELGREARLKKAVETARAIGSLRINKVLNLSEITRHCKEQGAAVNGSTINYFLTKLINKKSGGKVFAEKPEYAKYIIRIDCQPEQKTAATGQGTMEDNLIEIPDNKGKTLMEAMPNLEQILANTIKETSKQGKVITAICELPIDSQINIYEEIGGKLNIEEIKKQHIKNAVGYLKWMLSEKIFEKTGVRILLKRIGSQSHLIKIYKSGGQERVSPSEETAPERKTKKPATLKPEETVVIQETAPQKQIIIKTEQGALNKTSEWKQFERLFTSSQIYEDIIMFIGTKAAGRNITTKKDLSEFLTQQRNYNKIYTPRQLENVINLFFENISVKYGNGRFKITMDSDGNISVEIDPKIAAIDTPKKTEQIVSISCGRTPDAITQKQPLKTQPGYEEWVDSVAQKDSQNKAAYRHILTHIGEYPPETTVYTEDIGKSLKKANIVSTISDTALKFYIIHLLSKLKEDRGTFTVTDKRESGTIQGYLIYRTEESQRREKNNGAAATKITAQAKKEHEPLSKTTQSFLKRRVKNHRAQIKLNKNGDMFNDEYDDLKPLNFDFDIDEETGEK